MPPPRLAEQSRICTRAPATGGWASGLLVTPGVRLHRADTHRALLSPFAHQHGYCTVQCGRHMHRPPSARARGHSATGAAPGALLKLQRSRLFSLCAIRTMGVAAHVCKMRQQINNAMNAWDYLARTIKNHSSNADQCRISP